MDYSILVQLFGFGFVVVSVMFAFHYRYTMKIQRYLFQEVVLQWIAAKEGKHRDIDVFFNSIFCLSAGIEDEATKIIKKCHSLDDIGRKLINKGD